MKFVRFWITLAPVLLLVVATFAAAGTLEGRWALVEQHYGEGEANLAPTDRPVRLEFSRSGGNLDGRLWTGTDRGAALGWPAFVAEGTARPVEVRERSVSAGLDEVRVSYEVAPAPGDGTTLSVVEEYRLADEGKALVGTVTVSFRSDGEPRGSYVLHRRFERMP